MKTKNTAIIMLIIISLSCFVLSSCKNDNTTNEIKNTESTAVKGEYMLITQKEAKNIMDTNSSAIILDVRTPEEFSEGHIPGAILIPDYELSKKASDKLPDKNALILVYCRSGRRSAVAAKNLISMGYTNVKDFGGIITWEYNVEK